MKPDILTSVSAAAAPGAAKPAPVASRRLFGVIDDKFIAPIFISIILLGAHLTFGILEAPEKTLLSIAVSIAMEAMLGRLFYGKVPHLASAYISGISVGILVRSPEMWPYALCAAISITSKYAIRYKGRHIWNPSNLGITAMLFLAPQTVASLSIQWGNHIWAMMVIWALGSFIIMRLKRFHICLTYVLSFIAYAALRSAITGHAFLAEVAPITGPMYQLYIFFMITDPKTTVKSKKWQILVAFLIATMECILRLAQIIHAPYYALFLVGPVAYFIEIQMEERKKRLSAPPAAPATA